MATPDITFTIAVDTTAWDAAIAKAVRATRAIKVGPAHFWAVPPRPKTSSGMTARQYRTARRKYARTLAAIRRNR